MTEDEAAQQARARALRAEIERLKHGSADDGDTDSQPADEPDSATETGGEPVDGPDAATNPEGGPDAAAADPATTTSVRDWINKRMAEAPFEEEPDGNGESPAGAETGGEKDAHEGNPG